MDRKNSDDLVIHIKECEADYIQFIQNRLGIIIQSHQVHELHKTIINACHKFNLNPQEYLALLLDCESQSPLLEYLVSGITVGETYFFRDERQVQLLHKKLLPGIIQKKREQQDLSLRIWSAGCATGEEIYTIVMLLHELLPDLNQWTLQLLATDINTIALQKAIVGRYNEWSMRSINDYFKNTYFNKENQQYIVEQKIREKVTFDYLNLNEDSYPSMFNGTNAQDLILCRNVLIYFKPDCVERLMKKISACLVPGGYLLLGASDPVNISDTQLVFQHRDGLLFFRPDHQKKEKIAAASIIEKIIKKPLKRVEKKSTVIEYRPIVSMPENSAQEAIMNLANLGMLEEAVKLCQENLTHNSTDAVIHFTYALILTELNRHGDAEAALRKSLFLDHQFVAAHFQLGLLLLRNRQQEAGLKSLQNALSIAETKNPDESVMASQGLSYGRLAEILRHEIMLHTSSGNINYANENV